MILIADSGSTKTEWALTDGKYINYFRCTGINPMIQSKDQIKKYLELELQPQLLGKAVDTVYFYGAGCSSGKLNKTVEDALKEVLGNDILIHVDHDMLGAAKALFKDEKGLACILGTGSNFCYYDGKTTYQRVPSLGYILGDEGSGACLGKMFLRDYFYKRLPVGLNQIYEEKVGLDKDDVFQAVYKMPNPNRFLASFAKVIGEHRDQYDYLQQLIRKNFSDFFEAYLVHYQDQKHLPLGIIGSVAYHHKDIFGEVAGTFGFELKYSLQSPLGELVQYHISKL